MSEQREVKNLIANKEWGKRGTAAVSFAATIDFDRVDVKIGKKKILNQFSLEIAAGEIICLLGQSGSGKSTILRAAAGILPINSGTISINNNIVSKQNMVLPPQKRGVGLMFQDFALFPHMSLFENVSFGLSHLKKSEQIYQAKAALGRVGLLERKNDYPHMLSGGQQQRLALARTIAPRPGIIMLDEPFSGLDSRMRENVREQTMAVLKEIHATTIIVTHDPEEAMLMGDRIALLSNGSLIQVDSVENIYHQPINVEAARFLSPLSEIAGVVKNGKIQTPLGVINAKNKSENQKVIIAIRDADAIEIYKEKPGTRGRIISKREVLCDDIYEVQIEGLEQLLSVRKRSNPEFFVGSDVFLRLNVQHVLVFDQN